MTSSVGYLCVAIILATGVSCSEHNVKRGLGAALSYGLPPQIGYVSAAPGVAAVPAAGSLVPPRGYFFPGAPAPGAPYLARPYYAPAAAPAAYHASLGHAAAPAAYHAPLGHAAAPYSYGLGLGVASALPPSAYGPAQAGVAAAPYAAPAVLGKRAVEHGYLG